MFWVKVKLVADCVWSSEFVIFWDVQQSGYNMFLGVECTLPQGSFSPTTYYLWKAKGIFVAEISINMFFNQFMVIYLKLNKKRKSFLTSQRHKKQIEFNS